MSKRLCRGSPLWLPRSVRSSVKDPPSLERCLEMQVEMQLQRHTIVDAVDDWSDEWSSKRTVLIMVVEAHFLKVLVRHAPIGQAGPHRILNTDVLVV